jgi:hypothetical protein
MYGDLSNVNEFDLNLIDEELVYYVYLNVRPELNTKYYSPFKEERNPSFRFFIKDGKLLFKCFSTGYGGWFVDLVMIMYNIEYKQAIDKIKSDLGYTSDKLIYDRQFVDSLKIKNKVELAPSNIEVLLRTTLPEDLIYWGGYGINEKDLSFYDVKPCQQVWINDRCWYEYKKNNDLCYRFVVSGNYKIYRPNSISNSNKWRCNTNMKNIQGYRFLPKSGKLLVITKSYKDVMVLKKHLDIDSIAFNSESVNIPIESIEYLKTRFDNIVIFYDNDIAGIEHARNQSERTGIPYVYLPTELSKDPSDLYKELGKEQFIKQISKLLKL